MKAIAKLTTDAGWKPTVVLKPNTDLKSLVEREVEAVLKAVVEANCCGGDKS